jgi:hypothetical protein
MKKRLTSLFAIPSITAILLSGCVAEPGPRTPNPARTAHSKPVGAAPSSGYVPFADLNTRPRDPNMTPKRIEQLKNEGQWGDRDAGMEAALGGR